MFVMFLYFSLFILGFVFIHRKSFYYNNEVSFDFDVRVGYIMFVSFIITILIIEVASSTLRYNVNKTNLFINPKNATITEDEDGDFYILTNSSTGQMFVFDKDKVNVFNVTSEKDQIIEILGQYRVYYPDYPILYKLNHGFDAKYDSSYIVEQVNISIYNKPGENKSIEDIVRKDESFHYKDFNRFENKY